MAEIEVKDVEMKDASDPVADTTGVVEASKETATAQQETPAAADGEVEPELIPTVPLRKYTLESKYRDKILAFCAFLLVLILNVRSYQAVEHGENTERT